MKVEKFKVLLYLKKSSLDKSGKAPIMCRVAVNNSISQFSCKLSCTPGLWNPRESRLDGKSREAVEINQKIDKLLLAVHSAFDSFVERKKPFDAESVKNLYQGSMGKQMTLLALLNRHMDELKVRIGIDVAPTTLSTYAYGIFYFQSNRITKTVLVIDEAQDMNEDEFRLINTLMEQNEEMRVIAVGDDDQNIYEFIIIFVLSNYVEDTSGHNEAKQSHSERSNSYPKTQKKT